LGEEDASRLGQIVGGLDVGVLGRVFDEARDDPETYLLSAESHNLWRGAMPYDEYPMRRYISVHVCARLT
jgi:hypothetical protein